MTSSQHAPRGDLDLVIVLEVYRRPERRKTWTDPRQPLPQGLSLIVELANLPPGAARMKQYARQLHVSSSELHAAIGFFIRQVFLAPDADHYRVLGLNPGADTGRIKEHYRKLIGRFHPDHLQGRDAWYENYSVRINQAYTVLRNPSKRRAYDTGLRRRGRLDRHRSQHPARAENIRGIRSLSRRTRCIRVRARLALPRRTWQSIKTYASMQLRWRRKTIDIHDPNSAWRRWGLILSVAAIGGCLAFVLNTLVSLHLPSLVNAVRSGLRPPMTSPTSASRTAPAADTRPGLPDPASLSELSPSDTAEHHKPNTPAEHRAAAHGRTRRRQQKAARAPALAPTRP